MEIERCGASDNKDTDVSRRVEIEKQLQKSRGDNLSLYVKITSKNELDSSLVHAILTNLYVYSWHSFLH